MTRPTVMLYVQNLLGIGHLRRAAAVARALVTAGADVAFVSGGMPVPHLPLGGAKMVQLPPIRTEDGNFKVLLDETDTPIDDAFRDARRDRLLALFEELRPAALITELFPFGRRQMRFELLPLLERARQAEWHPQTFSSMRDILVTKPRRDRNQEIVDTLNAYYDAALIHSDPELIRLDRTFPMAAEITVEQHYTGYVVNADDIAVPEADPAATGEVLVSAGGGAVGDRFMPTVARMIPDLPLADRPWRLVTGHHMPSSALARIEAAVPTNAVIERSVPNLPELMAGAALSVSQAGYNTLLELLAARTRAVVVPYEGGVETEQRLRADLLADVGALEVVAEDALTAESLGAAMERARGRSRDAVPSVDLDGARKTAAYVMDRLARR
ncbi:glycosyltransferase family protein [Thalassobaculum litoreum]|uniref:Predicted glycosyl transferase n=1 Tax=Thalassobaculum litoreum DSM 18839 TaxID=1123362 RepID=A0A8G2BJV3_9PROT|nr:glycosyltransferase [Thalassobaculum litoreum]SDG11051.1 Predicted glycosyl transferase [Thalassobaculum litoreum DSM 18839]